MRNKLTRQLKKEIIKNQPTVLEYIYSFLDDISIESNKINIIKAIDSNPKFWNNINSIIIEYIEKEKRNLKI